MNREPTTEEKEQAVKAHREVDNHEIADFDYSGGENGVTRIEGMGSYYDREPKAAPILENLAGTLDYSESTVKDCQDSTEPVLDADELETDLNSRIEAGDLKGFRQQYNLALVRSLNCGPGDILMVKEKMMNLRPNDAESKKQLVFMVRVICQKMRGIE